MSSFLLIISLYVVALANGKVVPNEENEVGDRIHGDNWEIPGMKAKYGDRPFQVFVTNNNPFSASLCGGALIEWNWVLTAAHCVNYDGPTIPSGREIVVKVGLTNRVDDPAEQKQTVKSYNVHWAQWKGVKSGIVAPGKPWSKNVQDLLLLKLDKPFVSDGGKAGLVKLHEKSADTIRTGTKITISGWGVIHDKPPTYTDDLLVSTVDLERVVDENEFLELTDPEGNVSCGGDSGGPATIKVRRKAELVGILHAGDTDGCGKDESKAYYTSVYKYRSWICRTVDDKDKDNIARFCGGTSGGRINGGWTRWSAYGTCSKTCGSGTETRTRSCTNPEPSNGGRGCSGSTSQTRSCNTRSCPRSCRDRFSSSTCNRYQEKGWCYKWGYENYAKRCKKTCGACW